MIIWEQTRIWVFFCSDATHCASTDYLFNRKTIFQINTNSIQHTKHPQRNAISIANLGVRHGKVIPAIWEKSLHDYVGKTLLQKWA